MIPSVHTFKVAGSARTGRAAQGSARWVGILAVVEYLIIGAGIFAGVVVVALMTIGQFELEAVYLNLWDRLSGRTSRAKPESQSHPRDV